MDNVIDFPDLKNNNVLEMLDKLLPAMAESFLSCDFPLVEADEKAREVLEGMGKRARKMLRGFAKVIGNLVSMACAMEEDEQRDIFFSTATESARSSLNSFASMLTMSCTARAANNLEVTAEYASVVGMAELVAKRAKELMA